MTEKEETGRKKNKEVILRKKARHYTLVLVA